MRLFVHIYTMEADQLHQLLTILNQGEDAALARANAAPPLPKGDRGEILQRHVLIARLFVLIRQMDKEKLLERLKAFDHPEFHWSRAFHRMDCHLLVDFTVGGKAYRGYLRDISAGGIFIVTSDKFEIDQEAVLCFSMDESKEAIAFKLTGRIKRLYNDGIAIEYQDIPQHQQLVIDAMVKENECP